MLLSAALEREASAEQRRFRLKRLATFLEAPRGPGRGLRSSRVCCFSPCFGSGQDLDFRKCHRLYETQTHPISWFLVLARVGS